MIRNRGLDLLRIMSAIAVVLIHTNAKFYFSEQVDIQSVDYCISSIINLITRFSVPCFVMISGRFILSDNRNKDTKYFYRKSMPKLLVPLVGVYLIWTAYYLFSCICGKTTLLDFFCGFLSGTYGNLWFMPMIIVLYLLTPLFIRTRIQLSSRQNLLLGEILLIWGVISQSTSDYNLPYSIGVVSAYSAYFYVGGTLSEFKDGGKNLFWGIRGGYFDNSPPCICSYF